MQRADSLFSQAFGNYRGFPEHYLIAVNVYYNCKKSLNETYLADGFRVGLTFREAKSYLKTYKISYKASTLRKLHKKNHFKRKVDIAPLRKIFVKDQKVRYKKHGNIDAVDSTNFRKLMKLYYKSPQLFDRAYIGDQWQQLLEVMLLHQRWERVESYFQLYIAWAEQGRISRDFLSHIIDRNSVFGGYLFRYSAVKGLLASPNENLLLCHYLHCSILGTFSLYMKEKAEKEGHQYLVPLNPLYSKAEIDQIRDVILLSPLGISANSHKIALDASDFCEKDRKVNPEKK